jgi:hypothetical protein
MHLADLIFGLGPDGAGHLIKSRAGIALQYLPAAELDRLFWPQAHRAVVLDPEGAALVRDVDGRLGAELQRRRLRQKQPS